MGSRIFTSVLCIVFLNKFSGVILGDNELAGVEIRLCVDKSSVFIFLSLPSAKMCRFDSAESFMQAS